MKGKVVSMIDIIHSDNLKLSYTDVKVSGFPFVWKVQIVNPKISVIDQLKISEILSDHLYIVFNYRLTEATIDFDKSILFHDSRDEESKNYELLSSKDKFLLKVKFEKPIYLLDNNKLGSFLSLIKISDLDFVFMEDTKQCFSISDGKLSFDKTINKELENFNLKISGEYKSDFDFLKFQNSKMLLDLDYVVNTVEISDETDVKFERLLKVKKSDFTFDDSFLGIEGTIAFTKTKLPEGEIFVTITNYLELIDSIVPDEFIVSNVYLKRVVERVKNSGFNDEDENAKFKIRFGDDGITIGDINLLELGW
jgi:hypothetical protein